MEKFDIDENIKLVVRIMQLMGTWPKEYSSIRYKITGFTTILLITICTITTVTEGVKFVNIESTSFALCCTLALFHTVIKYFFLFSKRSQLFQLIDMLKTPTFALHEHHLNIFLKKKMKMCKQCSLILTGNAFSTGVIIILSTLVDKHTERPVPVPFPIDMKGQPFSIYALVWCFQSVTVLLTTLSIGCFDGLIFTFIATASAQLRILREQITHAADLSEPLISNVRKNHDLLVNSILKQCVQKHLSIERYIMLIEETFTNGFLIQLIISLLITCLIGFNLILVSVTSIDFGRCLFFFIAAAMELILFCVPGNEITLQSLKIRDACYMSDWVNCGTSVRKTLSIIMERSKRPFNLSAAGFVVLSLDTLLSVFKSAFSYFTMLQQIYEKPK